MLRKLLAGNEATTDCSKDETLHRSHPSANLLFQKAPEAASTYSLISQALTGGFRDFCLAVDRRLRLDKRPVWDDLEWRRRSG
jgi:chemotaxis response regulator CheB